MGKSWLDGEYLIILQCTHDLFTNDDVGNLSLDEVLVNIERSGGLKNLMYPLELVNEKDVIVEVGGYDSKRNTTKVWYRNIQVQYPITVTALNDTSARRLAIKQLKSEIRKQSQMLYNSHDLKVIEVIKGDKILDRVIDILKK